MSTKIDAAKNYIQSILPEDQAEEIINVSAGCMTPILILGETGTGKSVLAQQIHNIWAAKKNGRNANIFQRANCAQFDSSLVEAKLFGHTKGAFTGAVKDQKGWLELANNGTLFLDEIGEMPLGVQAKLLLATERKGHFLRLGDMEKEIHSTFRLICATNHRLDSLQNNQKFRTDLYHRAFVWKYELPPLRKVSDSKVLNNAINRALEKWGQDEDVNNPVEIMGSDARNTLMASILDSSENTWPGNYRELGRSIARLASIAISKPSKTISANDVENELSKLKLEWNTFSENNNLITRPSSILTLPERSDTLEQIIGLAEGKRAELSNGHHLPLFNCIEIILQDYVLKNKANGNAAAAARYIYRSPNSTPSKTDSAKFAQRRRLSYKIQ